MIKKTVLSLMVLIITLGSIYLYSRSPVKINNDITKPIMKIGIIAPLTGNNAIIGKNCVQGIEYALEGLKTSLVDYELMIEDDHFQAAKAALAASKLINIDKVDALFTCSSVSGSAATSLSKRNKKFMITVIASDVNIAKDNPYSFLHWPSPKTRR